MFFLDLSVSLRCVPLLSELKKLVKLQLLKSELEVHSVTYILGLALLKSGG